MLCYLRHHKRADCWHYPCHQGGHFWLGRFFEASHPQLRVVIANRASPKCHFGIQIKTLASRVLKLLYKMFSTSKAVLHKMQSQQCITAGSNYHNVVGLKDDDTSKHHSGLNHILVTTKRNIIQDWITFWSLASYSSIQYGMISPPKYQYILVWYIYEAAICK